MPDTSLPFRSIGGTFYRCVLIERAEAVLEPPAPESAGRYHRPGQPTLYTSASRDWAIIAISGYMREDGRRRVVIPLKVSGALVLDQHAAAACAALGIDRELSNESWRTALPKVVSLLRGGAPTRPAEPAPTA